MILQWRNANGEWMKQRQKGTKREQCCPVLFSVCYVSPTTHSEPQCSSTPDLSRYILQWRGHNFRVLMRCSLTVTALYLCIPIPFRTIYIVYGCFAVLRESHFLPWQIIYFCDRLWDIPSASESYVANAVTRCNGNGGIIDYTKNRYRCIRGDHEFMRYYGSAANGFTYPFITELVGVKFGYRILIRQLTQSESMTQFAPARWIIFPLSIALFADVDAIISR